MSFDVERLYKLLPAVYRIRDAKEVKPLDEKEVRPPLFSLLSVIADQVAVIEEDLAQLYDDQFIETCSEWVIPYIAELIDHPVRRGPAPTCISQRAEVANAIAYRRRKGTPAMLEQLARETTGWDARVVEFFNRLTCTPNLNHVIPQSRCTVEVRQLETMRRVNTAFDQLGHTVDVRNGKSGNGRYDPACVGIFLWRLKACKITNGTPGNDEGCHTFDALGKKVHLFNSPKPIKAGSLALPANVAEPLSQRALHEELKALRLAKAEENACKQLEAEQNNLAGQAEDLHVKLQTAKAAQDAQLRNDLEAAVRRNEVEIARICGKLEARRRSEAAAAEKWHEHQAYFGEHECVFRISRQRKGGIRN